MKIVLDANVFVSAYLWFGCPYQISLRYVQMLDTLFISDDILDELRRVFKKPKFGLNKKRFDCIMESIETNGQKVIVAAEHQAEDICRDPSDDIYLECALAAGADYLISGDNDLLTINEYGGIKIVNARDYLDIVG